MKNRLILLDYGSAGNAGFYINAWLKALDGRKVTGVVHRKCKEVGVDYKRLNYFGNINIELPWLPEVVVKISRMIDLYFGLILTMLTVHLLARRESVTIIVNIYQSFRVYEYFLRCLPKTVCKNLIIHDAVELAHNYPKFLMTDRKRLLHLADALIVHNQYSLIKLVEVMCPIYEVPFPLPAQSSVIVDKELSRPIKLLFIGSGRLEKGIENLCLSYDLLPVSAKDRIDLSIIGKNVLKFLPNTQLSRDINVEDRFVDDNEFENIIAKAHFVIFPYTGGSNSGVFANAISMNVPCITSKINMFSESQFYNIKLSFSTDRELTSLLEEISNMKDSEYKEIIKRLGLQREDYCKNFVKNIQVLYKELC